MSIFSGYCTTPDFVLIDNRNGNEIEHISTNNGIYASVQEGEDFMLYFSDSTWNSICFFDLNSGTKFQKRLPEGKMLATARHVVANRNSDWIDWPVFNEEKVVITYDRLPYSKGRYTEDSVIFIKK